ncbi:MAG TPA: BrnA antitoxin family protein [Vicinamibacterales bacterium]
MKKRYGQPDDENPEWTLEMFRQARPLAEVLPEVAEQMRRYQGQRGPQKAPTKQLVSLRIDRDVADALRASGRGWQTRANDALRAYAEKSGLVRERRPAFARKKRAKAIRAK